jgi:hypothetical protein
MKQIALWFLLHFFPSATLSGRKAKCRISLSRITDRFFPFLYLSKAKEIAQHLRSIITHSTHLRLELLSFGLSNLVANLEWSDQYKLRHLRE